MYIYMRETFSSTRALVEAKGKKVVKSKLDYKLRKLIPENKFTVDPSIDNPLQKYVVWSAKEESKSMDMRDLACSVLFLVS